MARTHPAGFEPRRDADFRRVVTVAPARRPSASGAGFTVLELVFVVAFAAILAGIAIPAVQTTVANYRLVAASNALAGKIAETRSEALKRNRMVWLRLENATRTAQVRTAAGGGGTQTIGSIFVLPDTVAFAGLAGTVNLQFDSTGRLVNPPQTVTLQSQPSGLQRVVTIVVTGRITIT